MSAAEAARRWGLDPSTVRYAILRERLPAAKSGGTWLVRREDMARVYGPEIAADDRDANNQAEESEMNSEEQSMMIMVDDPRKAELVRELADLVQGMAEGDRAALLEVARRMAGGPSR
jgi:excisionase family DNA binding protein